MRLKLNIDDDIDDDNDLGQSTSAPLSPVTTPSRFIQALVAVALAVLLTLASVQLLVPSLARWQSDQDIRTLDAQLAAIDASLQLLHVDTARATQRARRFLAQCHTAQAASTALSHLLARADAQAFNHHAHQRLESHTHVLKQAITFQRDTNATSEQLRALNFSLPLATHRTKRSVPVTTAQRRQLEEIQRRQRKLSSSIASLAVDSVVEASAVANAAEMEAHDRRVDAVLVESLRLLETEIEAHHHRQAAKRTGALVFYTLVTGVTGGYFWLAVVGRRRRRWRRLKAPTSWSWSTVQTFLLEIRDLLHSAIVRSCVAWWS